MTRRLGPGSRSPTPRCATTTSSCTPPMTLAWRRLRGELGATHGLFINGEWRKAEGTFAKRSPIDGSLVGSFAAGTRQDVREAVAAARAAAPGWAGNAWLERIAVNAPHGRPDRERQNGAGVDGQSRSARTAWKRSATSRVGGS